MKGGAYEQDLDATYDIYEEMRLFSAVELVGGSPRKQEKFSHHAPPFFSRDLKLMVGTHWGLITPLAPYTIDYEANCPTGTKPEWQYFSWKATVPSGTNIVFEAATATTQGGLGTAVQVGIGTATGNATIWTSDPNTVEYQLRNASPAQASRRWLRVSVTLNPTGTTTPTLTQWQQTFDCKPAE